MADVEDIGFQGVQIPQQQNVAGPMMVGAMVPNQANWANMNTPMGWRRGGRLVRAPNGKWRKNNRDGRLYSLQ